MHFRFLSRFFYFLTVGYVSLFQNLIACENIINADENCYIAKMNGENVYLVAERLNTKLAESWLDFLRDQTMYRVDERLKNTGRHGIYVGASTAKDIISSGLYKCDEIDQWMVYASTQGLMPIDIEKSVLMYMTVTTTPNALVTSHFGISEAVTIEKNGKISNRERPKNLSMHLHSFAAKLMLRLNPTRLFMINVPVAAMTYIILQTAPKGSVHYGSMEKIDYLRKLDKSLTAFLEINNPKIEDVFKFFPDKKKNYKSYLKVAEERFKFFAKRIRKGEFDNKPDYLREILSNYPYIVLNDKHLPLSIELDQVILLECAERNIMDNLSGSIEDIKSDLSFGKIGRSTQEVAILPLMEENPPILSEPKRGFMKVHDPKNPSTVLFTMKSDDPVYGFLFDVIRIASGIPPCYILAVDLDPLSKFCRLDEKFSLATH